MTKVILALLTVVGALFVGFEHYTRTADSPIVAVPNQATSSASTKVFHTGNSVSAQMAQFINKEYGFSFAYIIKPLGYSVFKNTTELNREQGKLFGVSLIRSDEYSEAQKAAANGLYHDGPRSITISVFEAPHVTNINDWLLKNVSETNCEEGSILATVIDGNDASSCQWDGLYSGVTVGLIHDNKVYLLTGTREEGGSSDSYSYATDFNDVVTSFAFIQ